MSKMDNYEEQKIELQAQELATIIKDYFKIDHLQWKHQKTEAITTKGVEQATWIHITLRKKEEANATENKG